MKLELYKKYVEKVNEAINEEWGIKDEKEQD